jgi:hypothetical protein
VLTTAARGDDVILVARTESQVAAVEEFYTDWFAQSGLTADYGLTGDTLPVRSIYFKSADINYLLDIYQALDGGTLFTVGSEVEH